MPVALAFLTPLLMQFGKWVLRRLVWVLIGGGGIMVGWTTGLLPLLLKALLLALFDFLCWVIDEGAGFLVWVLNEQDWNVPDAYSVMSHAPQFALDVLDAIGIWNAVGLLVTISLFKFAARIIGFRLIYR